MRLGNKRPKKKRISKQVLDNNLEVIPVLSSRLAYWIKQDSVEADKLEKKLIAKRLENILKKNRLGIITERSRRESQNPASNVDIMLTVLKDVEED